MVSGARPRQNLVRVARDPATRKELRFEARAPTNGHGGKASDI